MNLLHTPILYEFCKKHADCEQQVYAWIAEAKAAKWATPSDVKARYRSASFFADNRVVFNIKGNNYRLDTKIYYQRQSVWIVRMGTHADYDEWRF